MAEFAILFPGQGSQSVGMLADMASQFDDVQKKFAIASRILGYDLWDLVQHGPEDQLNQTIFTQPALLVADVAMWMCWRQKNNETPRFLAGHSLGEYAALVCAEALSFEDAVALVALRGEAMQSAVKTGKGAMAAIVGLDDDVVLAACKAAGGVVSPANYNSIGQVVIAGETHAVEKAMTLAKEKGAKLVKKIPVSVPSHCALMQPAADIMAKKLKTIVIKTPVIPVIQNAEAVAYSSLEKIRDALIQQLTSPVRWVETIQTMMTQGVKTFYECGPGNVLVGLNKRISKEIVTKCLFVDS